MKELADKKQPKKRRYKAITYFIRNTEFYQKSKALCVPFTPSKIMIEQMLREIDPNTWLRPSTIQAAIETVESNHIRVMADALEWRISALTPKETQEGGRVIEVDEKHIKGAFKCWARDRTGAFQSMFEKNETLLKESVDEQRISRKS